MGTQGPSTETGLQWVRVLGGSFLLGQEGLGERANAGGRNTVRHERIRV